MQRQSQQKLDPLPAFPLSPGEPVEVRLGNRLVFPEEVLLPEQFSASPVALEQGVRALISAVLSDAVLCFKKHIKETNPRSRRLGREAEEWFFRNDSEWPFSFISICDALKLDPEYIRQGLQQWRKTSASFSGKGARRVTRIGRRLKIAA